MGLKKDSSLKEALKLAKACSCEKCTTGCRVGSGFLVDGDEKKIAKFLHISVEELKEKYLEKREVYGTELWRPKTKKQPFGPCIFFDEKIGCTVHKVKPLECKVAMGCIPESDDLNVWFRVNYAVNPESDRGLDEWQSYLDLGGKTIPGTTVKQLKKSALPDK